MAAIVGGSIPEHCERRANSAREEKRKDAQKEEAYTSSFTSSSTGNLPEMARYYFKQGGKLLRPQICLLMGNACNQKATMLRWGWIY